MQLFQGEKPAHDFLSLHTGGGSSSPVQHSTPVTGYDLGVHTSLKPLKLRKRRGGGAIGMAPSGLEADSEEHVLPGGVGTFSIMQAPSSTAQPRGQPAGQGVVVRGAFAPGLHGSRTEGAHGAESGARAHSGPATMWQDSGTDQRSRGTRGDGRSSGSSADQGPNTPRSKHSATEQRRRTKINDRLEILRELLPHGDQKRDKASFLLEVIEYIRFLQEKVQKYESHPQKNHEDSSMPWAKVYYRSCWKNTENTSQVQGGGLSAPTQDMNNEQYCSKKSTVAPTALFSTQSAGETSIDDISSQKATSTPQNWADDSAPTKQPPWLSMSTSDSGNRTVSKIEKQTLHEDARSLSNAYSQGLLDRLTQALKRSGVDPSQASISVQINMDKKATEPSNMHSNLKDNECEETIHVAKKLRC